MAVESVGSIDTATIAAEDTREEQAQEQSTSWNGREVAKNPQTPDLAAAVKENLKQQQVAEDNDDASLAGRVDDDATETCNEMQEVAESCEPAATETAEAEVTDGSSL